MTEFPNEPVLPTLSDRLREAAVTRARARGDVVDDVVLDVDGVIDLTVEEPANPGGSITQPSAVLAFTRGQGVAEADMSDLYAPAMEDDKSWWQRVRRPSGAAASPTLSRVPLSTEHDDSSNEQDDTGVIPAPGSDTVIVPSVVDDAPEIDLTDTDTQEIRPKSACPECGGVGQRDLFDQVSKISYYSCDDCFTMWQASED
jgi:hypothetical protein